MIGADMFKLCCNNKNNVYVYLLHTFSNRSKKKIKGSPKIRAQKENN